jgi:hypothetical protein
MVDRMTNASRVAVVAGGYALAIVAAFGALFLRQLATSDPAAQASAGMYAFGDLVLFATVLIAFSVPPSAAALYFLRRYRAVWIGLATIAVIFAVIAVVAALFVASVMLSGPSS